jgi:hypothetical protein
MPNNTMDPNHESQPEGDTVVAVLPPAAGGPGRSLMEAR